MMVRCVVIVLDSGLEIVILVCLKLRLLMVSLVWFLKLKVGWLVVMLIVLVVVFLL